VAFAGCASTKVSNQDSLVTGKIARPDQIWVYDFVATPGDVPADSTISAEGSQHSTPQTAEQIATGRQVGAALASDLVDEIRAMGMPAARGSSATTPAIDDLVIRGYLLSVEKGSVVKRVAIGFGAGASELRVAVEGFQMTDHGLRKLGSGDVAAGGSKGPGEAIPAAVAIATANPVGLIVTSGIKVYGEASGRSGIEGRTKATAKEIAAHLETRFQEQGWIE
jgi:uncharacterized protein DUF4410